MFHFSEADLELEIAEVGHDDGVGVVGVGLGAEGQLEATRWVPCSSLETVAYRTIQRSHTVPYRYLVLKAVFRTRKYCIQVTETAYYSTKFF